MSVLTSTTTEQQFTAQQERRVALRRALKARPDDPRLRRALQRLTAPDQIAESAARGVFISYNRADEVFAFELREALCDAGVAVWLDMVDAEGDWQHAVNNALRTCGLMIAVVSPSAENDSAVHAERERFRAMGKLILPVMAARCEIEPGEFWLPTVDLSADFTRGMLTLRSAFNAG